MIPDLVDYTTMIEIISALWPVFALLLSGYLAKRLDFPGSAFWPPAERLIYFVLFPVLLVDRLARADMGQVPFDRVLYAVVLMLAVGSIACFLLKPWMRLDNPAFTSFYQGGLRFNTYVGLAATAALYSAAEVAVAAVVIAVMIPLLNVACVLVFSVTNPGRLSWRAVFKTLLSNPLILACTLGLLLNLSGVGLPSMVGAVTELLSRMALPLGLLAVGAGLSFKVLLQARLPMLVSAGVKLLLLPIIAACVGYVLQLEPVVLQVLVLFAALPTAPSAYILARQLGGDAPAMAAIITGQTLMSMITLPVVLTIYMNFF
ncbi:MAG: AEC family transporter [Pontibacterium sp.]